MGIGFQQPSNISYINYPKRRIIDTQGKKVVPDQLPRQKKYLLHINKSQRRKSSLLKGKMKRPRRRSSSLHELVKDVHKFMNQTDSCTLKKELGNYFTVASTHNSIEFAHGMKEGVWSSKISKGINDRDFIMERLLGTGGFGAVFKAKRKTTGKEYALKVQSMETMAHSTKFCGKRTPDEAALHIERTVLASCREHPFIVSLEYAFHTSNFAVLALEYVPGGTMSQLILNSPESRLPFSLCKTYMVQLILCLNFMHKKGIIYRDLKPSNILIALSGHLKLTDFGLAGSLVQHKRKKTDANNYLEGVYLETLSTLTPGMIRQDERTGSTVVSSGSDNSSDDSNEISEDDKSEIEIKEVHGNRLRWVRRRTVCGTAGYRPPEQVQERFTEYSSRNGYDERADWFSLGVCCYMMLTGRRPFPTRNELQRSEYSQRQNLLDENKSQIQICKLKDKNIMKKVLNDAEFRCLMFEVNFPEYFDDEPEAKLFINNLLCRNPDNRPRYEGIVNHNWMRGVIFSEEASSRRPIPQWVKDHAYLQSLNAMKHNIERQKDENKIRTKLNLQTCIENLCHDCYNQHGSTYAETFASKWLMDPSKKTWELFRHWEFISEDAMALEAKVINDLEAQSCRSICSITAKTVKSLKRKLNGFLHFWR